MGGRGWCHDLMLYIEAPLPSRWRHEANEGQGWTEETEGLFWSSHITAGKGHARPIGGFGREKKEKKLGDCCH